MNFSTGCIKFQTRHQSLTWSTMSKSSKFEKTSQNKGSFLENAFFIFENSSEDELAEEEDNLASKLFYFYPESVELDQQLFLVGVIQTYIVFSQNFEPKEEINLITMGNSKIALKTNGNLIMVHHYISNLLHCRYSVAHFQFQITL